MKYKIKISQYKKPSYLGKSLNFVFKNLNHVGNNQIE